MRHCRVCSSSTFHSPSLVSPGICSPSFLGAGDSNSGSWQGLGYMSPLDVLLLFLAVVLAPLPGQQFYISFFCMGQCSSGAGLVSMKVLTHGEPGKPLKSYLKMHIFMCCGCRRSMTKIGKRGLLGLNWVVRLDNKFCENSKRDKDSWKQKGLSDTAVSCVKR